MTQAQESILEQIIEAYENGKSLADLPLATDVDPYTLVFEVLDGNVSKKATLSSILPYLKPDIVEVVSSLPQASEQTMYKFYLVPISGSSLCNAYITVLNGSTYSWKQIGQEITIPSKLSDLEDDSTHRLVTDTEKQTWDGKGTYSKPQGGIPKTDMTTEVQTALEQAGNAQPKVAGKGLSTNDYDNTEKDKVAGAVRFNAAQELTGPQQAQALANLGLTIEDIAMYGIEFDTSVSSPTCTRIGNPALHKSLPIQSLMRGCLVDDSGNVVEYLPENDWTTATRDGSRGQVMVELPAHYRKFETSGTKRRVKISQVEISGYHFVPKQYVSAYEATVQRSVNKLASVVNNTADYRGGNNSSSWDDLAKSLLGRPATAISRTNFRTYARNRGAVGKNNCGWNCMTYDIQKELYWLFVIEYATLNSQAAYNAQLTSEGYRQGGLGDGVSTWDSTSWNNFNGYNPFVPCGHTDSLGNRTGVVQYDVKNDEETTLKTFSVPRYRGVENPFAHIWQWTDGINVQIRPDADEEPKSKVYIASDPAKFNDSNYDGYTYVGDEARNEGYVKSLIFGEGGEIMPDAVGGGSTTYFCDYHYTNIPSAVTLRGVYFGGHAYYGAYDGFVYANSIYAPSFTYASLGSRLCFIPA